MSSPATNEDSEALVISVCHYMERALVDAFTQLRASAAEKHLMQGVVAGWEWRELRLSFNSLSFSAARPTRRTERLPILQKFMNIMAQNSDRLLYQSVLQGFKARFKDKDKFQVKHAS